MGRHRESRKLSDNGAKTKPNKREILGIVENLDWLCVLVGVCFRVSGIYIHVYIPVVLPDMAALLLFFELPSVFKRVALLKQKATTCQACFAIGFCN